MLHRLKNSYKWRKWRGVVIVAIIILLFPILVGAIYAIPQPRVIDIDSGDLLSFYGVGFGIMGSFFTYRAEKADNEKEKIEKSKPKFIVNITREQDNENIYDIKILNYSNQKMANVGLYETFLTNKPQTEYSFKVTYLMENYKDNIGVDCNVTEDYDIIDADGYPKYIRILCDDTLGNSWDCCYNKANMDGRIHYYVDYIMLV